MRPSARRLVATIGLAALLAWGMWQPSRASDQSSDNANLGALVQSADRLIIQRAYGLDLRTSAVDSSLITLALQSESAPERRAAARAIGRLETPADVVSLIPMLHDRDDQVRYEAANAIALALHDPEAPDSGAYRAEAITALRSAVLTEKSGLAAGMMLEALGNCYPASVTASQVEDLLVRNTQMVVPVPPEFSLRQAGALRGLEALIRHDVGRPVSSATRAALRRLAVPSLGFEADTGPFLEALEALVLLRDDDAKTIVAASGFRCGQSMRVGRGAAASRPDCGWEIRRLGLQMMPGANRIFDPVLRSAMNDPSFRVRIEALRVQARDVTVTKSCTPLIDGLMDASPFVRMEAIRLLDPDCVERDDLRDRLSLFARDLGDPLKVTQWQVPAAALEAFVKFAPDDAWKRARDSGAIHPAWQVRATVARVAGALSGQPLSAALAGEIEPLVLLLSRDNEPNVRAEVLTALYQRKSPAVMGAAIDALRKTETYTPNDLVVYTAALVVRGRSDVAAIVPAFTSVLLPLPAPTVRMGLVGRQASRDARLEVISRLREFVRKDDDLAKALTPLLQDTDPPVAIAVADFIAALTGTRPEPRPFLAVGSPTSYRGPARASAGADGLCFHVVLQSGEFIGLRTFVTDAPMAAGRFERLALLGSYDGSAFFHAYPMAYLHGGSPGGNDFDAFGLNVDEFSPRHQARGTVAIARHARHTANMQLVFNLVDAPYLDRNFTLLGAVGSCLATDPPVDQMLDTLDRTLEGTRIKEMQACLPLVTPTMCAKRR